MIMNNESKGDVTVSSHGQKGDRGGRVVGIIENSIPDVGKDMIIGNVSLSHQGIYQGEKDLGTKSRRRKDEKYSQASSVTLCGD